MAKKRQHPEATPPRQQTPTSVELRLGPWLPWLLVLLGIAVYANGLSGPFVFDDINYVLYNPRAQQLTWQNVHSERPLLFYSLAANYQLGGFQPLGYKIFNLAVHLAAALTLYGLVRRTLLLPRFGQRFRDTAAGLAFAVAALWIVHPLTTESVTYIIHRGESMMGLFALLTLYCTLRGAQAPLLWRAWLWYTAAAVACGLGFWSKPFMIAVPVVVLLYDRIMLNDPWRTWAVRRGALYLLMLIPLGWAFWINTHDSLARLKTPDRQAASSPTAISSAQRAASGTATVPAPDPDFENGYPQRVNVLRYARSQFGVIAHYLRLVFWPYPLCADYFWKPADTLQRIVPPALLIGGLLLTTCWALWRYPAWGFLGAAFFLLLGPSSSFIPIEDIATERRMYLPLAAVIALLVLGTWELLGYLLRSGHAVEATEHKRRFRGVVLLLFVMAVWSGLTILRNFDYARDVDFCERVLQQVPENSRAAVNLARALTNEGELPENQQKRLGYYQRALKYLLDAEPVAPKNSFLHAQIGHVQAQLGNREEAVRRFRKAVALNDDNALFHLNLALVLEQKGTPASMDEARSHFQRAAKLGGQTEFRLAEAHAGLARYYTSRKKWRDAIGEYRKALSIEPDRIKYGIDFGMLLVQAGRLQDAHDQLARTCEIDRLHTAHGHAPVVEAHQYLALVCVELNRKDEAIAAAAEALRLAEKSGQPQKVDELRQLIEQLQTARP
ncbi:MAG: tetratricopeptide repeat protein [Planctomycetes bacterium]|nr:tetratricopeptide repeat protein [Planctomycetota bacterium]